MYPKGKNYVYPSVIQEHVHCSRKPPELHLKASINCVKKPSAVENIWQCTGMRNILLLYEFDSRLQLY